MSSKKPDLVSLFEAAIAIKSAEQRAAFLDESCGASAELRQQVEELLLSDEQAGSFLERPPVELEGTVLTDSAGENPAAALEARLASALDGDEAVVIGSAGHSVLKLFGNTIDVPHVVLRTSVAEGTDPIERPHSPEIPKTPTDSRYRLDGEIARGGMGAIIKGRDNDLGRDLAIKVLLDEHKAKPEVIQRFVEEAQIGGQLQHPGIAPIYELGQFADRRPFFSMKLVKGQTLSKLLAERGDIADERGRFLGIFEQVCQTMAYAHSRGVIHRDLKPANVMVGAFGEVQVMDWGLAKVLAAGGVADEKKALAKHKDVSVIQTLRSTGSDTPGSFGSAGSETQMGSVLGTPAYMPPEQALGEIDQLDQRADVFGLGAILCEILTGKPPYVGEDGMQVFRLASRGKLEDCHARLDTSGAEAELIAVARQCLSVEPGDRPRDAAAVAERITAYLESVETRLRETELQRAAEAARVVEERKRRRVTLALAASLLLMLVMGGGGWVYLDQQHSARVVAATVKVNEALGEARLHQGLADGVDVEQEGGLERQLQELKLARRSAEQAAELAGEEELAPSLRTSTDDLLAALSERTNEVAALARQSAADATLRDELELIRLSRAGGETEGLRQRQPVGPDGDEGSMQTAGSVYFDAPSGLRLYEQAFRDARMDVATAEVAEAVAWIRESAIREHLIAALDDWAMLLPREARAGGDNSKGAANTREGGVTRLRLLAILEGADDSTWRKAIRAALADGDMERLETLALEEEVSRQSPPLIAWLGARLLSVGKHETSVAILRTAQQRHPGDFWLNFELGESLERLNGREDEALGYYRAALSIRPRSTGAMLALSDQLGSMRRYDEADSVYRRAIELDPNNFRAHSYLGWSLAEQGKLDEAINELRAAIELNPDYAHTHYSLARPLIDQGKLDEAIGELRTAIELDPEIAEYHQKLGFVLKQQGRLDEAVAEFRTAIELDPEFALAHDSLGSTFFQQDMLDEAIAEFRTAIELDPDYAHPHFVIGMVLYLRGKLDEAIRKFRTAIELNPEIAAYHFFLGHSLGKQGNLDEAIAAFRTAIELDPDDATAHLDLGTCLLQQGNLDEASAEFRTAIELDPEMAKVHLKLGFVLQQQGKLDEAVDALRTAIEVDPDDAVAHRHLGNSLARQGKLDEAIAALRTAIALRPGNPEVLNQAAWIIARHPDTSGQYPRAEQAVAWARRGCELSQNDPNILNTLGVALYRNRQWPEAIEALQQSVERGLDTPGNWLFLAMSHWQLGDMEEARTWYDKSLSWEEENEPSAELRSFFAEAETVMAVTSPLLREK